MKTLFYYLMFAFAVNQSIAQNTFWIVKGGSGDEVGAYRGAHLDTTAAGNLIWFYNTQSIGTGYYSMAMEKWTRDGNSPYSELILGSAAHEQLHGFSLYNNEMYILGREEVEMKKSRMSKLSLVACT